VVVLLIRLDGDVRWNDFHSLFFLFRGGHTIDESSCISFHTWLFSVLSVNPEQNMTQCFISRGRKKIMVCHIVLFLAVKEKSPAQGFSAYPMQSCPLGIF
jgi:hypothetical protein